MIKMGKPLNQQRRGKGSPTFKSPSHRFYPKVSYYDFEGEGVVIDLVRDALRSAPLAVIRTERGDLLVPAVNGLVVGQSIYAGDQVEIAPGNIAKLKDIPDGERVFCIEKVPGDGGKFIRSAGSSAVVMSKTDKFVKLKMPSGKLISINANSRAIIGIAAGSGLNDKPILKAGKKFYMMKAEHRYWPKVSASSMNAVEHPFGGGRKHRHAGMPQTTSRNAPPGRKVGYIAAKRVGRKR